MPSRPNIIWILGDQHRAQALSCNGDPNVNTPHIDRLAAEGLNCTGAVSGFPLCCPFRGSMLSGVHPHKCVPGHEYRMPEAQKTVAHAFNDAGYHTAYFGKWHVDGFKEREGRAAMHIVPPERRGGFRKWVGYENNNSQWDCWVHGGEGKDAFHYRLGSYETDAMTDLFIEHLRDRSREIALNGDKPFFAVLSVQPPHDPYVAPPQWMCRHNPQSIQLRPNVPRIPRIEAEARRDLAGAYAMIENLDHNIGRIREALVQTNLADNTHILFFSDHGDMHGSQGQFRKTCPWEESIRIPFIMGGMQFYGHKRGRPNLPVNHVDIAPTSLGLCGIDKPAWMQGTDYSARRLEGRPQAPEPDSAYLQCVIPTGHGDSIDRPYRGLVTVDGWKYVCLESQPWLLFNLNEDPCEQANLAHNTKHGAQRRRLHQRLAQWVRDTGDSFKLPEVG